jgi:peptidoglycan hydrolase-like protein with peptidoglycan-binding domain
MGALVERVKTKRFSAGRPAAVLTALASILVLGNVSGASGAPRPNASYFGARGTTEAEAVSLSLDARVVRQVQAALRQRGYYAGALTGFMGQETQIAVQRFQIDHGARVWPLIDRRLLVGLGIKTGLWAARNLPAQG